MSGDSEFFIYKTGFEVKVVSDLIEALVSFKERKGDIPVFYDSGGKHEEIQSFTTEPETGSDDTLNENMPRRLVIS